MIRDDPYRTGRFVGDRESDERMDDPVRRIGGHGGATP